ncbi:hypothetical protein BGW80DRAFT_1347450 [Lactifluus volemus]|nr:hypothetical protein BGW80DRAFT_1347450 [Lactifluus volemus]
MSILTLLCYVRGDSVNKVFAVRIDNRKFVLDLKDAIKEATKVTFRDIEARSLILWKLFLPVDQSLKVTVDNLNPPNEDALLPIAILSDIFPDELDMRTIHILVAVESGAVPPMPYVQSPSADEETVRISIRGFIAALRPMLQDFFSNFQLPVWKPPATVDENTKRFYDILKIPCTNGKDPNLLLHGLGNDLNPYLDDVFCKRHRVLCNTPGAGKTRLLFEGLCRNWGFYFVAQQDMDNRIGVQDLEMMINRMKSSPGWVGNIFKDENFQDAKVRNEEIAEYRLNKVLLARWIVFRTFIQVARERNRGKLPDTIKRDWLFFQILPDIHIGDTHPFIALIEKCLVGVSTSFLKEMLSEHRPFEVLGPAFGHHGTFFYILDESQAAGENAKGLMGAFADANGANPRPVLRPIVQAWIVATPWSPDLKIIISGTGFSLSLIENVFNSGLGRRPTWEMVSTIGDFTDREIQRSYVARYIPPTFLQSNSGTVLLSRMFKWLRGRHRFTARFLEVLISGAWTATRPNSPHKLLDIYVHAYTTFTPIDGDHAILATEPDVQPPTVQGFQWANIDRKLLNELSNSIYTFITRGKYPMWYNNHKELVEHGLARFIDRGMEKLDVTEPIALMSALRHFETQGVTLEGHVEGDLQSDKGLGFEEAVLVSCTKLFRQGARLDQVFKFHGETPEWAHQMASIVVRLDDGTFEGFDISNENPVVPPGVAFFAQNPEDVERWMKSMHTGWCVPGTLMGPDLMTWLRLNDGRFLLVLFQAKCHLSGNIDTIAAEETASAIRTLCPANYFSSLTRIRETATKEIQDMLESINDVEECFTGERYNILRVVAAYSLGVNFNSRSSKVKEALQEDDHPLAMLNHALLLSSLTPSHSMPSILSSLSTALKRLRDDGKADAGQPRTKVRKTRRY